MKHARIILTEKTERKRLEIIYLLQFFFPIWNNAILGEG